MTEWWTYRLSDFLMFSPDTYLRLLQRVNEEGWPWAQGGSAAAGLMMMLCVTRWRGRRWAWSLASVLLALAWGAAGAGFLWRHYATLHWGAPAIAAAFGLQSLLLLAGAVAGPGGPSGGHGRAADARRPGSAVGLMLLFAGVAGHPLLAPLAGRSLWQAEWFALMPDPTVMATLGFLVLQRTRHDPQGPTAHWPRLLHGLAWPLPLAAAALAGITLGAMDMRTAALLPAAALIALWQARRQSRRATGHGKGR